MILKNFINLKFRQFHQLSIAALIKIVIIISSLGNFLTSLKRTLILLMIISVTRDSLKSVWNLE